MTVMTSRQFNQDTSGARRAAADGPVFITDHGTPSHVLMSMEEYRRLTQHGGNLLETLAMPGGEDIDFDPPKLDDWGLKPTDFS
jgi:prevent-host-death family protein